MKSRKTVNVASLLAEANRKLALPDSEYVTPDFRKGVASMIEAVLHATGNYKGYNFHGWTTDGGCDKWIALNDPSADKAPYIGDETRRFYYASEATTASKAERYPLALGWSTPA
jgi:hypothetical protein